MIDSSVVSAGSECALDCPADEVVQNSSLEGCSRDEATASICVIGMNAAGGHKLAMAARASAWKVHSGPSVPWSSGHAVWWLVLLSGGPVVP